MAPALRADEGDGEEDRGWLVDAESAGEARRIVHGTAPCPACSRGYLVDPGGADADPRCMVETDAGSDGLVLVAAVATGPAPVTTRSIELS